MRKIYDNRWPIALGVFTVTAYFASLLIPTISASAAGLAEVDSFCTDHSKICEDYTYYSSYDDNELVLGRW